MPMVFFIHMSLLGTTAVKVSNLNHLKQFHAQLFHHNLDRHHYWVAQLINHCTRVHASPAYVRTIFDSAPHPNALVFSSMLRFHSQMGAYHDLVTLFIQMQLCGLRPAVFVYLILIKSVGKSAIALHAHLLKLGYGCDRYVRNAIMDAYAKYGPVEVARKVFDEMCDKTVADWNSMISGYWNWGQEAEACRLFNLMPRRNVISWTTMITGHSKIRDLKSARSMKDAIKVFQEMPTKDVVSYNTLITGFAAHGQGTNAVKLMLKMKDEGRWEDVGRVRKAMREGGVRKTTGWSWVEYAGKMHKFIVGDRSHRRSNDIYQLLVELRRKMRAFGYTADKSCVTRDVEEEDKEEMNRSWQPLGMVFHLKLVPKKELARLKAKGVEEKILVNETAAQAES
ncbi:hypothetical protein U1Q18_035567 [Sarracenia purpurea var. burkii]